MKHDTTTDPADLAPSELAAVDRTAGWRGRALRLGIGALLGAALGFGYWALVGCTTGCVLTSSPFVASLYGALVGGAVAFPPAARS